MVQWEIVHKTVFKQNKPPFSPNPIKFLKVVWSKYSKLNRTSYSIFKLSVRKDLSTRKVKF